MEKNVIPQRTIQGYLTATITKTKTYAINRVLEDILFGTESDALSVLSSMKEIIVNYGCVSIADYYDLAGPPSNVYTNTKYGWLDLKDAKVIDSMDGYKISLPKVLILN